MSVDSGFLLEVFRNVYSARLNEVIGEADVTDEDGKVILSPDLKVRHRDSGYEYTIDKVDGEDGEVKVYLRSPETPRVEPPAEEKALLGQPPTDDLLDEQDPAAPREVAPEEVVPEESDPEEVVFVVDQKEFEDEYEVD
tara:strand:+ start:313 stop:729 length:417 start_codon:yes stop_codon:yes gene_type:complete